MLKSFDFFRKIRTDQELTSTTGGFFTIVSIIVIKWIYLGRCILDPVLITRFLSGKILYVFISQK